MKKLVLVEIIDDPGVSGGKPLADRAGGKRLLEAIKKRKADAVVMLRLDRMFLLRGHGHPLRLACTQRCPNVLQSLLVLLGPFADQS